MKKILSVILMIAMIVSYFPVKQVEAATPGTSELYWVLTVKKKAPIRDGNTADSATLTYAAKDTKLYGTPSRNAKGNAWFKVLYGEGNNQTAYIYGGNVTDTGKKVTVTNFIEAERYWVKATKEAPLRYGFSEDFKTVAKTDNGEIMRCIGRCVNQYGNVFLKVEYAGKELFVYEKNVEKHTCNFVDFAFEGASFKYCFECSAHSVDTTKVKDQEISLRAIETANKIASLRLNGMKEQQVYKLTNTYGLAIEAATVLTVYKAIAFCLIVQATYPVLQEMTEVFGTAVVRVMSQFDYQELKLADSYVVADVLEETYAVNGVSEEAKFVYRKVKIMKKDDCCSSINFVDSTKMSLLEACTYFTMVGDVYCESKEGAQVLAGMVGSNINAKERICEIHNENSVNQFPHYHVVGYYVKKERKYTTAGKHIFYGNSKAGYFPYEGLEKAKPNPVRWYK